MGKRRNSVHQGRSSPRKLETEQGGVEVQDLTPRYLKRNCEEKGRPHINLAF